VYKLVIVSAEAWKKNLTRDGWITNHAGPYSNIIRKEFLERETKKRIHERENFIFFQCSFVALN
jgi:hypothetical protein